MKSLYQKLSNLIKDKEVSISTITAIIGLATQIVQDVEINGLKLSNIDKKEAVLALASFVISKAPIEQSQKDFLQNVFMSDIASGVIDSLCDLDVHKVKEVVEKVFSCC